MPRDGAGTYDLPVGQPVSTGAVISSSTHNTLASDIATALTASIAKDGQTVAAANLPMGGFKHTNVGVATALTEYARASQVQDNVLAYLTGVAGTNTITATAALSMAALATGQRFTFIPANTNTGATTLQINGIGSAKNVYSRGEACFGGEIVAGVPCEVLYDGTQYHILNSQIAPASVGAIVPFAGATAPSGYLLCYGQEVSRTTYATLYGVIGTTYGVGDGSTTFNLPDLRGRVIAGQDDMGGSSANRLTGLTDGVDGDVLGGTGGLESTTLTSATMPAHTHGAGSLAADSGGVDHTHLVTGTTVGAGGGTAGGAFGSNQNTGNASAYLHTHTISGTSGSTGTGNAHNNVQPTIILNYVIKV